MPVALSVVVIVDAVQAFFLELSVYQKSVALLVETVSLVLLCPNCLRDRFFY